MLSNAVLLFKFLFKLWPFVKEVYFKNHDFQKAVRSNKTIVTLLMTSMVLLVLTVANARSAHEYAQMYAQAIREGKESNLQYKKLASEFADMSAEKVALVEKYEKTRDKVHTIELNNSALAAQNILLSHRVDDLKEINAEYRSRVLGIKRK